MTQHICPTREQLEQLLSGTLPDPPASDVEAHWAQCSVCEGTVVDLEAVHETYVERLRKHTVTREAHAKESSLLRQALDRAQTISPFPQTIATGNPNVDTARAKIPDNMPPLGVFGAYDLLEQIGRGGMGTVYRARHRRLEQEVAIKIVPGGQIQNPQIIARFDREMKAVGRLKHSNLVLAQDAGETEGNEFLYLVMELLDGVDLATLQRRLGQLPIPDACEITRQAAIALRYVHQQRQVHRDVKPSNLMVTRDGTVKLLDLGLALLSDSPEHELTTAGQLMGTLDYMAPEQASSSHEVDGRADVYSLGCTFFALLAGKAPFGDASYAKPARKILAHATIAAPNVNATRGDLPDGVIELVDRMLRKSPGERPTLNEVIDTLTRFNHDADLVSLLEAKPENMPVPPAERETISQARPRPFAATSRSKHGWQFWTSIAAMLLIGGFGLAQVVIIIKRNGQKERIVVQEDQTATIHGRTREVDIKQVPPKLSNKAQSPTTPLGARTLVAEPRQLPGVDSWTIETAAPRVFANNSNNWARFSPDGRWLLTYGTDRTPLRVWNAETAKLYRMFPTQAGRPSEREDTVAISADSRFVVVAAGNLRMWEIETGRIVFKHDYNDDWLPLGAESVALSPDGKLLATSAHREIQIWDIAKAALIQTLEMTFSDDFRCQGDARFAWSPDSRQLVGIAKMPSPAEQPMSGSIVVDLFDISTGTRLKSETYTTDKWNFDYISRLEWSPDGSRIAIGCPDYCITVWNVTDWKLEQEIPVTFQQPALRWLDNGKQLAAGDLRYDFSTNERHPIALQPPSQEGFISDWSPDGKSIVKFTHFPEQSIRIFDVASQQSRTLLTLPHVLTPFPVRTEWRSNQQISFGGWLWDVSKQQRMGKDTAEFRHPYDRSWPSPDGKYQLVRRESSDRSGAEPLFLRRIDGSEPDRVLKANGNPVTPVNRCAAVWSRDSRIVAVADELTLRIWEVESGTLISQLSFEQDGWAGYALALSPDATQIIGGGAHAILGLRTIAGELVADSQPHRKLPYMDQGSFDLATWSNDGSRWRAIDYLGRIIEWDTKTGFETSRNTFRLGGLPHDDVRLFKSPDESVIAFQDSNCLHLMDADSLRSLGTIVHLGEYVNTGFETSRWMFVTPDGQIKGRVDAETDLRYIIERNGVVEMMTPSEFQLKFGEQVDHK